MEITEGNFEVSMHPAVSIGGKPLKACSENVVQREILALLKRNQQLREENAGLRKEVQVYEEAYKERAK